MELSKETIANVKPSFEELYERELSDAGCEEYFGRVLQLFEILWEIEQEQKIVARKLANKQ